MSIENVEQANTKSSRQNGIVQFENTIRNLSIAPNGDHELRKMCERWAVQSIDGELQLTRTEMIEILLAAASALGRRLGSMQQDAQKRIRAIATRMYSGSE